MSETGSGIAELNREWLAARIVFVVGFVIAVGFAVFWSMTRNVGMTAMGGEQAVAASGQAAAPTSEGMMACRASVILAENFGVVPNTLKFSGGPNKTDTVGRYTCLADDKAGTRYSVTFDLVCRQLNDARCVLLYQASKPDGTVLYQRQAMSPDTSAQTPAPDTSATDGSTEAVPPATPEGASPGDASSGESSSPQQQP
jgi:hypothetical protein